MMLRVDQIESHISTSSPQQARSVRPSDVLMFLVCVSVGQGGAARGRPGERTGLLRRCHQSSLAFCAWPFPLLYSLQYIKNVKHKERRDNARGGWDFVVVNADAIVRAGVDGFIATDLGGCGAPPPCSECAPVA